MRARPDSVWVSSGLGTWDFWDSPGSFTFIGTNSGGATGAVEETGKPRPLEALPQSKAALP